MGTGMCSRRQKGLLQTGFCLVTVACLGSGVFMYNHLQQKVRNAEALAQKYKQQQEALSAQLQVVYEHRSRLERSLQKERGEHKKTKEDFLVYKLEAQEALNKEKQDSMNRYGALSSQHKILKNQHEDVKKQLLDLQLQHNSLKLEHRKTLETHSQKYAQLQQEKDNEVANLQDTVFKLREESKLLRKAHQEVHSQLLNAQAQMEEFRQLKEALQKMPSFKGGGAGKGQQQFQVLKEQPVVPANSPLQLVRQKAFPVNQENRPVGNPLASQVSGVQKQADRPPLQGQNSYGNDGPRPQANVLFTHPAPLQDANSLPDAVPAWPARRGDGRVIRFTRTMNSLPNGNPDLKMVMRIQVKSNAESQAPGLPLPDVKQPSAAEKPQMPENHQPTGNKQVQMQSWKDIVNKVNAQMDEEQAHSYPKSLHFDPKPGQEMQKGSPQPPSQRRGEEHQTADQEGEKERTDDEELEMDAGVIEREENLNSQKETVVQEPMMPDDAADPAQDPNNQGEDEFEEAELERPDFEEKVGGLEKFKEPSVKEESKEKPLKDSDRPAKPREDPMDDYQEDQEQEIVRHQGGSWR
ncbi:Golgi integral membrane protein 4-like isoform X2 [Falco rusticolus]|uniref:Golgi integral membrane protein 4-like isoform X2 n=1 Tax=Falco cherrug TaxID=345164 RepID=UPI000FFC346E|nr:Golgi integral membrane protein 4-like isoform X2 [Falco cherrug]XP_037235813.1 Golgi integral membrane protein 4-like isoform X2 [Falco rusticolus]